MKNAVLGILALCTTMQLSTTPALAFTDPLERPAEISDRATKSPLFGLTTDGQNNVVTVGPRGHILYSQNAGKNFTQSPVPLSTDLVAVHFPTATKGWAVGHDGVVIHTNDGGSSWQRQLDGRTLGEIASAYYATLEPTENIERAQEYAQVLKEIGPVRAFLDVYFEDENTGWAVGVFNLIFHTIDGGKTWIPWMHRVENPEEFSLHAIHKVGNEIFIAGELGLALRLDREQQRFTRLETNYPGSFFGLTGNDQLVVLFGLQGTILVSKNQGASWKTIENNSIVAINSGAALTDGRIVLANNRGELLYLNAEGSAIEHKEPGRIAVYGIAPVNNGLITIGPRGLNLIKQP